MAKNDKQKLFDTSYQKVQNTEKEYGGLFDKAGSRSDTTWDRATENYNPAFEGYKSYAQGGGLTQEDKDRMQAAVNRYGAAAGGGGGGGGYSWNNVTNPLAGKTSAYASAYRPDYGEADTGFRELSSKTGGFDQAKLDQIYGNTNQLTEIGKTGGITDEDKANINRESILERERTGGYSEQDKALIRAKSAASSPAYFSALKDNMDRARSATGNLAGAGTTDFKLARQGAQQQAQDRLGADIGLQESIRQGKQQAGDFLSQQNMQLTGLRTANQLQGARSAGDLGLNTQQAITANKLQGLQGLQSSQTGLGQWGLGQAGGLDDFTMGQGQMDLQTQLANSQGQMQAGAGNAAASSANARAAAAADMEYQQWLTEYGNQQKQYGIGGLESLYNTNLGASQNYSNMGESLLNSKAGSQASLLGLATQNRGTTGMENLGTIANAAGAVAGAATGLGGLSGLATNAFKQPGSGIVQGAGGQAGYQGNPFQTNPFGGSQTNRRTYF